MMKMIGSGSTDAPGAVPNARPSEEGEHVCEDTASSLPSLIIAFDFKLIFSLAHSNFVIFCCLFFTFFIYYS